MEFKRDVDVVIKVPEPRKAIQYGRFNQGEEMRIFENEDYRKQQYLQFTKRTGFESRIT